MLIELRLDGVIVPSLNTIIIIVILKIVYRTVQKCNKNKISECMHILLELTYQGHREIRRNHSKVLSCCFPYIG